MEGDVAKALEIMTQAMEVEQQGREFYLKAAETTLDTKGRETFRTLADDEKNHFSLLKKQYDALSKDAEWTELPQVTKRKASDLDRPLFPKGKGALEKVVTSKSGDLDALLFGLDIENKSYDLYRQAALETVDSLGKEMFQFLAGEERRHFEILMMRYEYLAGPVGWQS